MTTQLDVLRARVHWFDRVLVVQLIWMLALWLGPLPTALGLVGFTAGVRAGRRHARRRATP